MASKYRVIAPMGITLPAQTKLLNLSKGQLDRLSDHLEPGKGGVRVLARPAQFKIGEEIELPGAVAKVHQQFLELVAEPVEPKGGVARSGAGQGQAGQGQAGQSQPGQGEAGEGSGGKEPGAKGAGNQAT